MLEDLLILFGVPWCSVVLLGRSPSVLQTFVRFAPWCFRGLSVLPFFSGLRNEYFCVVTRGVVWCRLDQTPLDTLPSRRHLIGIPLQALFPWRWWIILVLSSKDLPLPPRCWFVRICRGISLNSRCSRRKIRCSRRGNITWRIRYTSSPWLPHVGFGCQSHLMLPKGCACGPEPVPTNNSGTQ